MPRRRHGAPKNDANSTASTVAGGNTNASAPAASRANANANAEAGSSTGPGTTSKKDKAARPPGRRRDVSASASAAPDPNPSDPAANTDEAQTHSQGRKRRRRSTTFAHKRRRGVFPGRAYVLPREGLEEWKRMSVPVSVSGASAVAGSVRGVFGRYGDEEGEGDGDGEGEGREGGEGRTGGVDAGHGGAAPGLTADGEPGGNDSTGDADADADADAGAAPAHTPTSLPGPGPPPPTSQQSVPPPNGQQATHSQPPEDPWAARAETRRARALDSILLSSLALGMNAGGELPSDSLLLALHAHAAAFFAAHGALAVPRPVWRGRLFDSVKRMQLTEDADAAADEAAFTSAYRFGRLIADDDPLVAEYEAERAEYERDQARAVYRRHKRVDMHTALEGGALLALGILVEETVARELRLAGYVPRASVGTAEGGVRDGAAGEGDEDGDEPNGNAGI